MAGSLIGREAELATLQAAIDARRPTVITGAAGVGKTHLALSASRRAREQGWSVELLAASDGARALPFGALARLIPPESGSRTPQELIGAIAARVRERAAAGPLLLVIDDAHRLDPGSATLLQHLVLDGAAAVVFSVRSGEPCPDTVRALWRDGHVERIDVGPLTRGAVTDLIATTLPGTPSSSLAAEVWRLSAGNPLFATELIAAAGAADRLEEVDGIWFASAPLAGSERLSDMVTSRLAALAPEDREAVELLAVGEPMDLPLARSALGAERLERLEELRFAAVDADARMVRAAHPIHGELLRAAMPRSRRARHAETLADVIIARGTHTAQDALVASSLLLEAGRTPTPDIALAGAREALVVFDAALAERLAAAAAAEHPFEAKLVTGRALRLREDAEGALSALGEAARLARGDAEVGEVALARARTHLWLRGDLPAATTVLEDAAAAVADDAWEATIEAELALHLATAGDLAAGRRVAEQALGRPGITPRAELAALVVATLGQALALDVDRLEQAVARGLELARELRSVDPMAHDQLLLARATLLAYVAPGEMTALAAQQREPHSPLLGVWDMAAGMARLVIGDCTGAVEVLREAVAALERTDPFANHPMACGVLAVALAQRGDVDHLAGLRERLASPQVQREPRARVWAARAEVWEAAATGQHDHAVDLAVTAGREALDHDHVAWGCDVLHDAVRLGTPGPVADTLVAVTADTGAAVAEAFGRHATALAARDTAALQEVAASFTAAGALIHAAEAHAQAASVHAAEGRSGAAARAAARAQVLTAQCPGAATPALAGLDRLGLSERALQVARRAAAGQTNRQIAAALVLSHRTVENHLSRVYTKLDIGGRAELPPLLAPDADGA